MNRTVTVVLAVAVVLLLAMNVYQSVVLYRVVEAVEAFGAGVEGALSGLGDLPEGSADVTHDPYVAGSDIERALEWWQSEIGPLDRTGYCNTWSAIPGDLPQGDLPPDVDTAAVSQVLAEECPQRQ